MKKYSLVVFAALVLLLSGCASMKSINKDIAIDTAADPKANLNGYKSYAWLGSAGLLNDPNGLWEPPNFDMAGDIKFLIKQNLNNRGLTLVEPADADLAVAFFLGVDMDSQKLEQNPETKVEMLQNVPEGALVVALIDAETGYAVWVGKATAEVQQQYSTEEVKERLKYAIDEMFKKLPRK